jgi:hypothetical protein
VAQFGSALREFCLPDGVRREQLHSANKSGVIGIANVLSADEAGLASPANQQHLPVSFQPIITTGASLTLIAAIGRYAA